MRRWYRAEDGEDDGDDSDVVKWKKHWTMRKVVAVKKRNQVDQAIGQDPGTPGYMQQYAGGLNEVLKSLSKEEEREYEQLAKEWNKSHPPREVQIRSVTSKLSDIWLSDIFCHYIGCSAAKKSVCASTLSFVRHMKQQYGAEVVVYVGYQHAKNAARYAMFVECNPCDSMTNMIPG